MKTIRAVVVEVHKFEATVIVNDNNEIVDILDYGDTIEPTENDLFVEKSVGLLETV